MQHRLCFLRMEDKSPIISAGFLPLPPYPGSRRSQQRWYRSVDLIRLCNWALLALKELHHGVLTRALLQRDPPFGEATAGARVGPVTARLQKILEKVDPPFDRLKSDAALKRLRGYETSRTPILSSKRNEKNPLPIKGDMIPSVVEEIALPAPGSKPVPISLLSPKARGWMEKPMTMLATQEEVTENLQKVPDKPYVDENLNSPKKMLALGARMAKANMLRGVKVRRGGVGLFTVVKKVTVDTDGSVTNVQRLIFDQRRDNAYWKKPPWAGLASPSAMAMIDVSEEWNENMIFQVGSGDLPNYYYTLELPEWISEWFVLPIIKTEELVNHLISLGDHEAAANLNTGEYLGMKVPLMGWNWAVPIAQMVLEDMVSDPKNPARSLWDIDSRLIEGGLQARLTIERPLTYTYIDDFGALGLATRDGSTNRPKELKEETTQHIRSLGLEVHKEVLDEEATILGITVGGSPPMVQPPRERLWEMVEILWTLARRAKAKPAWVETAVATFNWLALIVRLTLSVFEASYQWIRENRDLHGEVELPENVRCELAAAAAILPLIRQDLSQPWNLEVMEVDASYEGGAIVGTQSNIQELREEARWAVKGNWLTQNESMQEEAILQEMSENQPEIPAGIQVKPVKVFRFLNLFAGHRRQHDLEHYLRLGGAKRGWLVLVKNVDLGYGEQHDLGSETVMRSLLIQIEMGLYDGLHTQPPCSSWSAVRWRPDGPPPVRSRDRPWGLPGLSKKLTNLVTLHSILMKNSGRAISAMSEAGGTISKEHPAARGYAPFPSIFATAYWKELCRKAGLRHTTFPQCMLGAPTKKMTTIASKGLAMKRFQLCCSHTSHSEVLFGLDEEGNFRTRKAQAYPPEMCEALAEEHLTAWEEREPLMGEERAAEQILEEMKSKQPDLGERFMVPEVGPMWDPVERWRLLAQWTWETEEHNNVLEMRTAVAAAERMSRDQKNWDRRSLVISDSQATIGALSKGRSSKRIFNRLCRKACSIALGMGIKVYWRYIRTHRNVSDGPSRQKPLGYAGEAPVLPEAGEGAWNQLPKVFYLKTRG